MERILYTAFKVNNTVYEGGKMERHIDVWKKFNLSGIVKGQDVTAGFISNSGRFLNRVEAGVIAYSAGQIKHPCDCLISEMLF